MKLPKKIHIDFTIDLIKVFKVVKIGVGFVWKLLPWAIIIFLLLTRSAHAATMPVRRANLPSVSDGGLSSLIVKPDISNDLLNKLQDAQKPPEPVVVPEPAPAPEAAVEPSFTPGNDYFWGQCVWYVANRKSVPAGWGNASDWLANAQAQGWSTGTEPRVGAVAWFPIGGEGHVAYTEAVNDDGTIQVSEMNVLGLGVVDYKTIDAHSVEYIY